MSLLAKCKILDEKLAGYYQKHVSKEPSLVKVELKQPNEPISKKYDPKLFDKAFLEASKDYFAYY